MEKNWYVHKFGGTSVANAARISKVSELLKVQKGTHLGVVVSALSGVTNGLIRCGELATQGDERYLTELQTLKVLHVSETQKLLPVSDAHELETLLTSDFSKIKEILRGVFLSRSLSPQTHDMICGHGEIWSAQILNRLLKSQGVDSIWLDARQVLVVYQNETGICVDWERSKVNFSQWYSQNHHHSRIVITGFIASTQDGVQTTLGRNGSDFSASIFGALFRAQEITIWTDVDGVLSADPRLVPDAIVLDFMSYNEATELAYFGAKVLHPSTMAPAIEGSIPIWIRNTFNPTHPGTKISQGDPNSAETVRAISAIQEMALVTVEGTGMIGVPGIAQRLFGTLKDAKISVALISQASSEHSICFAVPNEQARLAKSVLEKAFYPELQGKQIYTIDTAEHCGILAAVGDGMANQPGTAAKLFDALARGGINIRAIAQGASERNISVVIDQRDVQRAMRIVHTAYFLSPQTLSIGLLGIGNVGKTLLDQMQKELHALKDKMKIDLKIRGIANSKKMLLSDDGLDLEGWQSQFETTAAPFDEKQFIAHIKSNHLPHSVLIDCTADDRLSTQYTTWLESRIHVISANKKANTDSLAFYQSVRRACKKTNTQFRYETNVGAGLPIINTLQELLETGDRIHKIEGVLSGTLSFLFNRFDGTTPFSGLVQEAKALGYTEPDPREDLSGMDVARKLIILARELGLLVELKDVKVENLGSYSDEEMSAKYARALERNLVLRYVGVILLEQPGPGHGPEMNLSATIKVGLETYPQDHSFARIRGRDNIVAFNTQRYSPEPLVIQGAGAGPAVTAAGVFADLLRLAHSCGGRP